MGWLDKRTPMPPLRLTNGRGMSARAGSTRVSGPGQKLPDQQFRERGYCCDQGVEHRPVGDQHGKRIVGIAALELKNLFDGGKIQGVRAEAVESFGGEDDHLAAFERGESCCQICGFVGLHCFVYGSANTVEPGFPRARE